MSDTDTDHAKAERIRERVRGLRVDRYVAAYKANRVRVSDHDLEMVHTIFDLILHPPELNASHESIRILRAKFTSEIRDFYVTLQHIAKALIDNENDLEAAEAELRKHF